MKSFSKPISRITALAEEPSWHRRLGNVNWGPLLAALALAVIGVATIRSASSELGVDYASRQAVRVVLGLLAMALVFRFDYRRLVDAAPLFYGIGLFLLVLVLFVGDVRGGARSWLSIGPIGGQPSELAKLATVMLLARYLGGIRRAHLTLEQVLIAVSIVAVPLILTALERDLGGAAMFVPLLAAMLFVAGVRLRLIIGAGLVGMLLAGGFWELGMKPYQRNRIISFVSPEADPLGAGYQVRQSKIAVGSGQWTGRGYGQGTQSQLRFLPERHTDFVLAVLAEEWGFLGVLTVLGLYGVFFTSAISIAVRSRHRAGILLITGLVATMAFHVIYNASMVVGLLPVTGIPVPFLSYGGSFTLISFLATGLILNVDFRRYVNR
ncbi:MAG: rod shape-determining protein RodA [Holophagales bacterium]|nr:rod shape-determining protein RodA [Holophagales bacterium]